MASLYDKDFNCWLIEQADLLRQRRFDALDTENLIEEIQSLARDQRAKIATHLATLLELRILYDHVPTSPERDTCYADIVEQQVQIEARDETSPSLYQCLPALLEKQWTRARTSARWRLETAYGMPDTVLSEPCPYAIADLLPHLTRPDEMAPIRE
jgi:hypothetical protein